MKKLNIILLIIVIILCIYTVFRIMQNNNPSVSINNKHFYVDIAKTNGQKATGLDIYDKMPQDKGMIFPFDSPGYYSFWMKGMKFSIDIIYIYNNKIVDIFESLPYPKTENENPVVVKPSFPANFVLEINSGISKKYNFKKGDEVKISL